MTERFIEATQASRAALFSRRIQGEVVMAFASNQEYLTGIGHRTAALEDSRLLPLVEITEAP